MATQRGGSGLSGSAPVRVGSVAVLLVLAVVVARARAGGMMPHVEGPAGSVVIGIIRTVGVAVITGGLVLLLWGSRRLSEPYGAGTAKKKLTEAQKKRLIVSALVGVIVACIYNFLLHGFGQGKKQQPRQEPPPPDQANASHHVAQQGQAHPPSEAGNGTYITVLIAAFAVVALVVILLRKGGTTILEADEDDADAEAEAVARAVAAGQAAVHDRTIVDPREAIVACFAAMEGALTGVGGDVRPRAADTPEEVLLRGIEGSSLPETPARDLLRLFHEARFSSHPMGDPDREAADRALDEILGALNVRSGR